MFRYTHWLVLHLKDKAADITNRRHNPCCEENLVNRQFDPTAARQGLRQQSRRSRQGQVWLSREALNNA